MGEPVTEIDEYFDELHRLAQVVVGTSAASHEFVENPPTAHSAAVQRCLAFRTNLLSQDEERALSAYFELGLFEELSRRKSTAAFAFAFDLQHAVDALEIERQCERYDESQPLFIGAPTLFQKIRRRGSGGSLDYELIEARSIEAIAESEIYRVESGFGKLTHYLNPGIVNWSRAKFRGAPLFVRLDPHFFSEKQPLQLLSEATLVPANPKWLAGFSLRAGMKEFAAYSLDDVSWKDDAAECWDYRVKGIRRLEVRVERRQEDYLTMMIEELPRPDDPNGLMIGRCVHLDTRDPAGTPLDKVEITHLDLAINVYQGDKRAVRDHQTLQQGMIVDASCRTHLLRIEQVPFISLFQFCRMFFSSSVLLAKWLIDLRLVPAKAK